jgi:tellurite resistance protein TerC
VGFLAVVLICLAFDLGVFHREARVVRSREAFLFTGIWVALACGFSFLVHKAYAGDHGTGPIALHDYQPIEAVQLYFTAYLVEYSLSLDNIVVIALIFTQFGVPRAPAPRALRGVLGAIVMRFGFILAGSALLAEID